MVGISLYPGWLLVRDCPSPVESGNSAPKLRASLPRLARGDGWNAGANQQAGAGSIPAVDGRVTIFEQFGDCGSAICRSVQAIGHSCQSFEWSGIRNHQFSYALCGIASRLKTIADAYRPQGISSLQAQRPVIVTGVV